MQKTIVLATRNKNKQRELQDLLKTTNWTVLSMQEFPDCPEIEEDGRTFLENAEKKALAVAAYTGLPCLADDSGLEVDALGNAPGVRSARYARGVGSTDEENTARVLDELRNTPDEKRTARFVCAAVIAVGEEILFSVLQNVEGVLTRAPIGANGFGYDPVFYYPPFQKTFAEVNAEEKNQVSHRARALKSVVEFLNAYNSDQKLLNNRVK
ncbi:MAG: XTP/dITP diphosphatase [Candidatus Omnitrophota bacterium]|jgi:XTP/dITP diphosphohydrolase|nr:MAG: XTP/dITP diphosphatase [Candidatus Omnitrophota bacterium]